MIPTINQPTGRAAFTLIETLIVLMIAGVLMVSATTLLVNFTILRAKPVEAFEFTDHVNGLSDFLNAALAGDALPPAYSTKTEANESQAFIRLGRFPDQSRFQAPKIEFDLPGNHPLCEGTESHNPVLRAQLVWLNPGGLFLHWLVESNDPRISEGVEYHRLLSPWVEAMRYAYYDSEMESWDIEAQLQDDPSQTDRYLLPHALLIDLRESSDAEITTLYIYLNSEELILHD